MGQVKRFTAKKIKTLKSQITDWINAESADKNANAILERELSKVLDGVLNGTYDDELNKMNDPESTVIRKDCVIIKKNKTSAPYMIKTQGDSERGDHFKQSMKKPRSKFIASE